VTRPRPRTLLVIGAVLALGWAGYAGAQKLHADRAAPLERRIESMRAFIAEASDERVRHRGVTAELDAIVDRTLGGDLETVDHALRTRLNRFGEEIGLDGLTVNTGRHVARETPARSQLRKPAERTLRDEIDFVELEGTVAGEGTLEQAIRLVHAIDAAPWMKRIDVVRVDPRDGGARLAVTMRLTTLFLPGRAPSAAPSDAIDPAGFDRHRALVERNPFALLPPAVPPPPPAAPAPKAYDYGRWTITGIVETPAGAEVWLRDAQTSRTRRLAVTEGLEDVVLTAVRGDLAVFESGNETFVVAIGQTLASRRSRK
jgi:hypothetical protein